jgi:hypothetical protein
VVALRVSHPEIKKTMSPHDDSTENTATADILQPIDLDKEALLWDGNNAKILGLLDGCGKFYVRKGLFQPFFKHRAVLLSNGKTAVPSKHSIPFVMGELSDSYSFDDICPAIADRVAEVDTQRTLDGDKPFDWKAISTVPEIIINTLSTDSEDGKFLKSLTIEYT